MTFIHPLLLGGLLLAGIPVLLHLIMRQKPKQLLFPAFRFLLARHRTNQRKLRLRHLLLLALRVLLIALVCLALARPKILSEGLGLGSQQPVAAVLIFDTSFSMEYVSGGRNRLDEARSRALELLAEMPEGSRVALLDTTVDSAEPSGEWVSVAQARERIELLRLRPNNAPVTGRLADAYRLLGDLDNEQAGGEQPLPKFLYVFSDRTEGSWDAGRIKDLQALRERVASGVNAVLVDVGAENPVNLAITEVKPRRQVIATGQNLIVEATVRAVGGDGINVLKCRVGDAVDQKEVRLSAGQSQVFTFERAGLQPGFHRIEVMLGTTDALAFDNARFATAEVRGGRNVLVIADNPHDAEVWKLALESGKAFRCQVSATRDVDKLPDLTGFQVVCLLSVANPESAGLWPLLERYVEKGGGLMVIPGGSELKLEPYENATAKKLLPGRLVKIVTWPRDAHVDWDWNESIFRHPLLRPYQEDRRKESTDFVRHPPGADRYWEVEPYPEQGSVLVRYADKEKRPAILETTPKNGRGRVLLLTTKLDGDEQWNNYLESITSFYLALAWRTCGYLAGDAEETNFNFLSGQLVTMPLPLQSRHPNYTVRGPGLTGTQAIVSRREEQSELEVPQAVTAGTYVLVDKTDKPIGQFSVNIPPEESLLTRVPAEQVEELFGPGAVVPVDKRTNLREALQNRWGQPVELLPWLMILVLLALAVENLLANKFYRPTPTEGETAAV